VMTRCVAKYEYPTFRLQLLVRTTHGHQLFSLEELYYT
jgi:hypothetical protein